MHSLTHSLLTHRIAACYWFDYRLFDVYVVEDLLYVKTVYIYQGSKVTTMFLKYSCLLLLKGELC